MQNVTMPEIMSSFMGSENNSVTISDSWAQGRAIFGGLVAALGVAGIEKCLADAKPLRSVMANFVAPLPAGSSSVQAKIMREGKSVTQGLADVMAGDQVACHLSAAFGLSREASAKHEPSVRSDLPQVQPEYCVPPEAKKRLPAFLSNFDLQWTGGGIPVSNDKSQVLSMWVRHAASMAEHPLAKLIAVADVPPPIIMSHYDKMVMGSSLSWSLEFVRPAEEIESDWFYLDFTLEGAANGYTQQSGKIYDQHGRLCLLTRQCMVYFE